jgi:ribosome-binding protein aMBF1 (putative translation factor)
VWSVVFHPHAEAELTGLITGERTAILHAVDKLSALGPQLPFPHQSHVEGAQGVRELRPRAGRSRWRAFYGQVGEAFVIAAIGPEAQVDRRGFEKQSQQPLGDSPRSSHDHEEVTMKLSDLESSDKVLARQLKDPTFRAEWERTAVARAVATRVIEYRAEHGVTQTELARRLGMKQPAVARLEAGEHTPSLDTLARLSSALNIDFHIRVTPDGVAI